MVAFGGRHLERARWPSRDQRPRRDLAATSIEVLRAGGGICGPGSTTASVCSGASSSRAVDTRTAIGRVRCRPADAMVARSLRNSTSDHTSPSSHSRDPGRNSTVLTMPLPPPVGSTSSAEPTDRPPDDRSTPRPAGPARNLRQARCRREHEPAGNGKAADVRQDVEVTARPHLIAPPRRPAHLGGPVKDSLGFWSCGELLGLDIDDQGWMILARQEEVGDVPMQGVLTVLITTSAAPRSITRQGRSQPATAGPAPSGSYTARAHRWWPTRTTPGGAAGPDENQAGAPARHAPTGRHQPPPRSSTLRPQPHPRTEPRCWATPASPRQPGCAHRQISEITDTPPPHK